ncbi:hypothetical protein BDZ45DRAFT_800806 [Acephala macrosclerotiorum]|nr:hypothetical protein BDZ45DRAFT_800806 [Acephala macrosclerotiorum]
MQGSKHVMGPHLGGNLQPTSFAADALIINNIHTHRIALGPLYVRLSLEQAQIRIVAQPQNPVPNILHVYQLSREIGLQSGHWGLLPYANPTTYYPNGKFRCTAYGTMLWIGDAGLKESLTIVIKNPRKHDEEIAVGEDISAPVLKELTLDTVRAQAAEVVLKHIRGFDDDGEDEAQTFRKAQGKELTALNPTPIFNSTEDISYLEKMGMQTRIHRLAFGMRTMGYQHRNLLRKMRIDGLQVLDD